MATVRAFIALELPEHTKREIAGIQDSLRTAAQRQGRAVAGALKWVAPESIHLTLRFLGPTDEGLLPRLEELLAAAAVDQKAFALMLAGIGAFPNARRPRVLWVGIQGDLERLAALQQRIEEGVVALGFRAEPRGFSPHLTLARVREGQPPAVLAGISSLLATPVRLSDAALRVNSLSLMRSELLPTGARYTSLHTITLPS